MDDREKCGFGIKVFFVYCDGRSTATAGLSGLNYDEATPKGHSWDTIPWGGIGYSVRQLAGFLLAGPYGVAKNDGATKSVRRQPKQ